MGKNLIFIPAYNGHGLELDKCIKSWKYYAKKYEIEIIVANNEINFDFEKWGEVPGYLPELYLEK